MARPAHAHQVGHHQVCAQVRRRAAGPQVQGAGPSLFPSLRLLPLGKGRLWQPLAMFCNSQDQEDCLFPCASGGSAAHEVAWI